MLSVNAYLQNTVNLPAEKTIFVNNYGSENKKDADDYKPNKNCIHVLAPCQNIYIYGDGDDDIFINIEKNANVSIYMLLSNKMCFDDFISTLK